MVQRTLPSILATAVLALGVVACTAGSGIATLDGGAASDSATSSRGPAGDGKDAALGAACTAYLACCEDLAGTTPRIAMSCDATRKQIESAEANGLSTDGLESACRSGVEALETAGYCGAKTASPAPPPPAKKCAPSCTRDADCVSTCPGALGSVACCDVNTRSCFLSKSPVCPKPDPGPPDPAPSY